MKLSELIATLQDIQSKKGDMDTEFVLHSYTQVHPTVYLRNKPEIYVAWDGVTRITLSTGPDVRISILNKKVIAYVDKE